MNYGNQLDDDIEQEIAIRASRGLTSKREIIRARMSHTRSVDALARRGEMPEHLEPTQTAADVTPSRSTLRKAHKLMSEAVSPLDQEILSAKMEQRTLASVAKKLGMHRGRIDKRLARIRRTLAAGKRFPKKHYSVARPKITWRHKSSKHAINRDPSFSASEMRDKLFGSRRTSLERDWSCIP